MFKTGHKIKILVNYDFQSNLFNYDNNIVTIFIVEKAIGGNIERINKLINLIRLNHFI